MSVCLHSSFHSGGVLTHFPSSTNRQAQHSSCLTRRRQFSAGTEDAVAQGWLALPVFQLNFIQSQLQDGFFPALASVGCQAVLIALSCDAMGYHYAFREFAQCNEYSNFTIMKMPLDLLNFTGC